MCILFLAAFPFLYCVVFKTSEEWIRGGGRITSIESEPPRYFPVDSDRSIIGQSLDFLIEAYTIILMNIQNQIP